MKPGNIMHATEIHYKVPQENISGPEKWVGNPLQIFPFPVPVQCQQFCIICSNPLLPVPVPFPFPVPCNVNAPLESAINIFDLSRHLYEDRIIQKPIILRFYWRAASILMKINQTYLFKLNKFKKFWPYRVQSCSYLYVWKRNITCNYPICSLR